MAVNLTQIRQGLANNLSTLQNIQVSAHMLANPTPPTVTLYPAQIDWQMAMGRGLDQFTFTVQAFVGLTSEIGAQDKLDQFLDPYGPQSIRNAIESDNRLGGLVQDVNCISTTGYRVYVREGAPPVLGAEWTVQVLTSGS